MTSCSSSTATSSSPPLSSVESWPAQPGRTSIFPSVSVPSGRVSASGSGATRAMDSWPCGGRPTPPSGRSLSATSGAGRMTTTTAEPLSRGGPSRSSARTSYTCGTRPPGSGASVLISPPWSHGTQHKTQSGKGSGGHKGRACSSSGRRWASGGLRSSPSTLRTLSPPEGIGSLLGRP